MLDEVETSGGRVELGGVLQIRGNHCLDVEGEMVVLKRRVADELQILPNELLRRRARGGIGYRNEYGHIAIPPLARHHRAHWPTKATPRPERSALVFSAVTA